MAGQRVSDFSISDPNGEALILSSQKSYRGHIELTLTNMNNTSAPQIAAGSVVEVGGALYEFPSAESITGSPSDGTVYVKLIPNGASVTAEYTNTAPTWSDAKQGWYGTGATAGHRYVATFAKDGSTYSSKYIGVKNRVYKSKPTEVSFTGTSIYAALSDTLNMPIEVSEGKLYKIFYKADVKFVGASSGDVYYLTLNPDTTSTGTIKPFAGNSSTRKIYQTNNTIIGGGVLSVFDSSLSAQMVYTDSTYITIVMVSSVYCDKSGSLKIEEYQLTSSSKTGYVKNRYLEIVEL